MGIQLHLKVFHFEYFYPFDRKNLHSFIEARAAYKKACRNAEKSFRYTLTRKLMEVGKHDPKAFWRIIEKTNHWGAEEVDPTDNISPKKWFFIFL